MRSGLAARVVGFVFFCSFGGFLVLLRLGWVPGEVMVSPTILGLLGVGCILLGLAAVVVSHSIVINRRERVAVSSWNALGLGVVRREYELASFDRVTITRKERRSGGGRSGSYTLYFPVRLEGSSATLTLDSWNRNPTKARRLAEELAVLVGCRLDDSSSGAKIVRAAEDLRKPLRERLLERGEPPALPKRPSPMKSQWAIKGRNLILHIPPTGFNADRLLWVTGGFLCLGGGGAGAYFDFAQRQPGTGLAYYRPGVLLCGLLAGIGFVLLLHGLCAALRNSVRIVASPEALRVEKRGLLGTRLSEFATDELRDVVVFDPRTRRSLDGPYVFVTTGHKAVKFGEGLSAEELRWLCAALKQGVVLDHLKRPEQRL